MCNSKVMVLGTFHFFDEGVEYLDILSDKRQKEVLDIVEKLAMFKPNKIVVECQPENAQTLNDRYKKFCCDGIIDTNSSADVDETVMLGFRLAKQCNVPYLHCIDYMNEWLQNEAMKYAVSNFPQISEEITKKAEEHIKCVMTQLDKPLKDFYCYYNTDESINMQHSHTFLIYNQIGAGDNYIGTKFVSSWYERNLRIFANLQNICEDNDRVLVIYGAGHLAILNSFIKDYYKMDFINPIPFLES